MHGSLLYMIIKTNNSNLGDISLRTDDAVKANRAQDEHTEK